MQHKWTQAADQYLVEAWCDGASAGEIAGVLGVSRNAVIGRVSRIGLTPAQQRQRAASVNRRDLGRKSVAPALRRARQARYLAVHRPPPLLPRSRSGKLRLTKPPPATSKERLRAQFEEAWRNTAQLGGSHGTHTL